MTHDPTLLILAAVIMIALAVAVWNDDRDDD